MDEIFYEIKEIKNQSDVTTEKNQEVIFHFLAKAGETLILYETKQIYSVLEDKAIPDGILGSIEKIISQVNPSLKLINGKIREIFLSYSH
ncbi:MAG: hypothetical protein ACFE9R_12885 [Candidatus Hermodarchaeota archaeon]